MMQIIITGGGGYLAGRLREYPATQGGYELTLINRSQRADRDMLIADLAAWNPGSTDSFSNAQAVVHLAESCTRGDSWADLQGNNIEAHSTCSRQRARGKAGCVVLASTRLSRRCGRHQHRDITVRLMPYSEILWQILYYCVIALPLSPDIRHSWSF
jgi:nucleoside-diphosphate-sugar epimerase